MRNRPRVAVASSVPAGRNMCFGAITDEGDVVIRNRGRSYLDMKAAHLLLTDRLATAAIASNDLSAIGQLDTMLRAGMRVPEDLSVVSYDDSRFARPPGIDRASVRQDMPQMAQPAV